MLSGKRAMSSTNLVKRMDGTDCEVKRDINGTADIRTLVESKDQQF